MMIIRTYRTTRNVAAPCLRMRDSYLTARKRNAQKSLLLFPLVIITDKEKLFLLVYKQAFLSNY